MTAADIIRERITASPQKMLPWHEVMNIALYEPHVGYYRKGVRRIGRGGDFYTSVSVGPLFGALLAEFCFAIWNTLQQPGAFTIIEQGAHDGTLAGDVLTALQTNHQEMFERVTYTIIEPDKTLREAQRSRLAAFDARTRHVSSWDELVAAPMKGVLLCNELLDAFPVHRVIMRNGEWNEAHVRCDEPGGFVFDEGPLSSETLRDELHALGKDFPSGFTTEQNIDMLVWLRSIAKTGFQGAILIADYGHGAREYFAPERGAGTLRRYRQHQSDDKILEDLGECDLTAHVNFTRLAQEAQILGWEVTEFIEQGRFLTKLAAGTMMQQGFQPDATWMRQFQSLTHPSHLGQSFQIMTLAKGISADAERRDAVMRRLGMVDDLA